MPPHKIFKPVLFILTLLLGFGLGAYWQSNRPESSGLLTVREGQEGYKFINPLLFTKSTVEGESPEYGPIKKSITEYVVEAIRQNKATDISVYFRNLNSGQWISINPDETYAPASMLKVLTLITVMRAAESDPGLLEKTVKIVGEDGALVNSQVRYPVKDPIRSGSFYSVQTLIDHLIIDSDNVANVALINLVGEKKIKKTYEDLELPEPNSVTGGYTTREYSHLFRVLFNGTYLSHNLSENVLELLSKTNFVNGLVAGVPDGTTVSHKFGIKTTGADRELHDCGIVYLPQRPYFICIMTRGQDFDSLEAAIKEISGLVWAGAKNLKN